ncbi:MAG: hypothetical protein OER95_19215, partial [Acidimicrobiia bacterium]|nr:hypothetical protein [Acidimicrobiia bacterium]
SPEGAEGGVSEAEQDKLVKALDRATKAVPKAETALAKAEEKAAAETAAIDERAKLVVAAEARVLAVENEIRTVPRPVTRVTALTEPVQLGPFADHLPASYHRRQETEPHESPPTMTIPLIVLAFLAVVGGALNLPFSSDLHFLGHWLEPSLFGHEAEIAASAGVKWVLGAIAVAGGLIALTGAYTVYLRSRVDPARIESRALVNAWYVDETYANFMDGPGRKLFDGLAWFDRNVIDGLVRGVAVVSQSIGSVLRVLQPGFVRSYALGISLFSVLIMAWFVGRLF